MGFSGGGSNLLKAHTHDGTIVQDGGALNMDNVTQAGLQAGDIVYSDGLHLQRLAYPGAPAGENLTAGAASTAPSWTASPAGGAWSFLEQFTQSSSATYMDCELSSDYVYADFNSLAITYILKADLSDNGCGVGLRYANSGTSYHSSAYFNIASFNSDSTGVTKIFYSNLAGTPLLSDDTVGNGVTDNMVVHGGIRFYDSVLVSGIHWLKPFTQWCYAAGYSSSQTGFCYHEDGSNRSTLSAFRFAMSEDDFSVTGTNQIDADSQVTFWTVANS